jgi:hypothetical protein
MIVFILVGSVFSLFGAVLLYIRFHYTTHAREVRGHIVGIEKRKSISRNRGSQRTQILYVPVIEYSFRGELICFTPKGASSNGIFNYEIGKEVRLLSLDDGPEFVMLKESFVKTLALVFFLIGVGFIGLGGYQLKEMKLNSLFDIIFHFLPLIIVVPTLMVIFYKMKKFYRTHPEAIQKSMLKSAQLESSQSLKGREIFRSQREVNKEKESITKMGRILTFFFIALLTALTFIVWNKLPASVQKILITFVKEMKNGDQVLELILSGSKELIAFIFIIFILGLCILTLLKRNKE